MQMKRWKYIKEQEEVVNANNNFDKKITNILKILRDEDFGNSEQRAKFVDLLTTLYNSKDPRARATFKKLGQALTDIGDSLIKSGK